MPATGSSAIMAECGGYRSLIMFDPALKIGVVALWNGSSGQPCGLEFEVMDMFYRLEPRDWLALDEKPGADAGGGGRRGRKQQLGRIRRQLIVIPAKAPELEKRDSPSFAGRKHRGTVPLMA